MFKREGTFLSNYLLFRSKLDEKRISSKKVILPGMLVLVDELIFYV